MTTTFTAGNRIQGVRGTSIINNCIRVKLGLSMEEYAVLDAIQSIKTSKKPIRFDEIFLRTGIPHALIVDELRELQDRKFIEKKEGKIILCAKWNNEFDVTLQFAEFWEAFQKRGNKNEALKNYRKAIQIVSPDELLEKAKLYVSTVSEWKFLKHASVWLNPTNRHWEDAINPPDNPNIYHEKND